jgi:hypothetical protein
MFYSSVYSKREVLNPDSVIDQDFKDIWEDVLTWKDYVDMLEMIQLGYKKALHIYSFEV